MGALPPSAPGPSRHPLTSRGPAGSASRRGRSRRGRGAGGTSSPSRRPGPIAGVNYDAHFDVGADWQTFDVPFSAFEATWRSRPVTADKLDPAAVTALQFYQSKFDTGGVNPLFEEGAFELQVKAIEALH